MTMAGTKKFTLAELEQERREIEEEFEGAETVELIVDPNLTIGFITDEEAERLRLPPEPDDDPEAARAKLADEDRR
jgi:hypothetical protein